MPTQRLALVLFAFLGASETRLWAQNPGQEAKTLPLDQPPVLNRIFPPALTQGKTTRLELRGNGVENTQELLASRQGLAFKVLAPEPLPLSLIHI